MVTAPRRSRRAATASAQISPCWRASASSDPSSASTTSRTVSSSAARANEYPPFTPRCELRMPARRKVANRPSRNWTGMSRRRAISPIGTGPAPPLRASSASARTAYGDLDVMASIAPTRLSGLDSEPPPTLTQNLLRLDPWLPPLALMAAIFFFSAQPDLNSGLGTIDLVGRKIVHMSEYALLCFLWWRALRTVVAPIPAILLALAIAIAYACTDELHQRSVHG